MKNFMWLVLVIFVFAATAGAETIKAAGSGGMISLVTELGKAYMAKNPADMIEVNQSSIEAKGGIVGVTEGKLDIGLSARFLEQDETSLGLTAHEIALAAAVPAVHADSVKVSSLTAAQICDIYAGKVQNWKQVGGNDAPIKVFTRQEPDSTKVAVRKGLKCFGTLAEAPSVVVLTKSKDMVNALSNTPNSIGFTDVVAVDDSGGKITALKIDGVAPSDQNVKSKKWPLIKPYILVTKGEPKGAVKKFYDFISGPEGTAIITKNKAVPVK